MAKYKNIHRTFLLLPANRGSLKKECSVSPSPNTVPPHQTAATRLLHYAAPDCRNRKQKPTESHLLQPRVETGADCPGLQDESMGASFGLTGTQGSASCCFGSLGNMVPISSWLFPNIYCEEILCKHAD